LGEGSTFTLRLPPKLSPREPLESLSAFDDVPVEHLAAGGD
jgi:hypothetical protein